MSHKKDDSNGPNAVPEVPSPQLDPGEVEVVFPEDFETSPEDVPQSNGGSVRFERFDEEHGYGWAV